MIPNLSNIFQRGWNHQLATIFFGRGVLRGVLIRGIEEQFFWKPFGWGVSPDPSGSVIFLPQSDPKPMPNVADSGTFTPLEN